MIYAKNKYFIIISLTILISFSPSYAFASLSLTPLDRVSQSSMSDLAPYITLNHNYLYKDPVTVYVISQSSDQSSEYVNEVIKSIQKWSDLLKSYSGNDMAWNFDIISISRSDDISHLLATNPPDIVIELIGEAIDVCGVLGSTIRPDASQPIPIYSEIRTSCILENEVVSAGHRVLYSTSLHEFGHVLGLGHTSYKDGDLMCSDQFDRSENVSPSCINSTLAEPSELNIKALLHMYGLDGLGLPNRNGMEGSYFMLP
jgi:hypothetical protein